jgi:hypothetical protein
MGLQPCPLHEAREEKTTRYVGGPAIGRGQFGDFPALTGPEGAIWGDPGPTSGVSSLFSSWPDPAILRILNGSPFYASLTWPNAGMDVSLRGRGRALQLPRRLETPEVGPWSGFSRHPGPEKVGNPRRWPLRYASRSRRGTRSSLEKAYGPRSRASGSVTCTRKCRCATLNPSLASSVGQNAANAYRAFA